MTTAQTNCILLLCTDGFEESDLFSPRQSFLDAGIEVFLASIDKNPKRFDRHRPTAASPLVSAEADARYLVAADRTDAE